MQRTVGAPLDESEEWIMCNACGMRHRPFRVRLEQARPATPERSRRSQFVGELFTFGLLVLGLVLLAWATIAPPAN